MALDTFSERTSRIVYNDSTTFQRLMYSQQDSTHTPPQHSQPISSSIDSLPSRYLQVPGLRHTRRLPSLHRSRSTHKPLEDRLEVPEERSTSEPLPIIPGTSPRTTPESPSSHRGSSLQFTSLQDRLYMSVYSTSSIDSDLSEFSNPPARSYRLPNSHKMPRKISVVRLQTDDTVAHMVETNMF